MEMEVRKVVYHTKFFDTVFLLQAAYYSLEL